jgi:PAS domain S-box-containing protein
MAEPGDRSKEELLADLEAAEERIRELEAQREAESREHRAANRRLRAEIRERSRVEGELRKSEGRLRAVLERSPLGMSLSDSDGRLVLLNAAFTVTLGYTAEDLPDVDAWWERAYPDERVREIARDAWFRALAMTRAPGDPTPTREWDIRCRDGSVKSIEIRAVPVGDHALTIFLDVTERRRGEAILREYREALESSEEMIAIFDRDRVLRTVNEAFLEMRGLERRDVLGRPASEVLGASAFGRIEAHLSRCFGGETVELETRLVHPQRGIRNHVVRYYPVRSPTGDVDRVVEMVRDVTEFRRAEKEKDLVFRHSIDPMCVAGLDGYFREMNPAWEKVLGWSIEELRSKPWLEFVHPEDREATAEAGEHLLAGKPMIRFENRYIRKDGTYRWLSWNSFPDVRRGEIFAVARDITAQKSMEAEREKLIAELQKALDQVRKLSGLLPICANCKKIRDDGGYWHQVESYVKARTDVEFSHGLCPECFQDLYPDYK